MLLFGGLGYLLSTIRPPFYAARASIIIDPRMGESIENSLAAAFLTADALVVDSEVEILRSEQLLRRVVGKLDLLRAASAAYARTGETPPADEVLMQETIEALNQDLKIEREGQTFIIRILAKSENPVLAAQIANAIAEEYFADQIENRIARADQIGEWLREQIASMGEEVIESETQVERYKFDNDIPDENVIGTVEREIAVADQALIEARLKIREAEAEIETIERAIDSPEQGPSENQRLLVLALGGRDEVRTTQVRDELARLRETRMTRIAITESEIASLTSRRNELKARLAEINEKQVQLRKLRRQSLALQAQYESFLVRFEESQGADRFARSNARVIERAVPPMEPGNTPPVIVIIAAALGGLVVSFGLIFLREQLNDTLRSSDDVTGDLGMSYLGPLPRLRRGDATALPREIEARAGHLKPAERREIARLSHAAVYPLSRLSETLRRSFFEIKAGGAETCKIVAATSAVAGEGKSFYAANLAFFLARQGYRVLLVDADARRPHLSRSFTPLFGAPAETGADAAGKTEAPEAIGTAALLPNLHIMYRAEFGDAQIAAEHIGQIPARIRQASDELDYVIIDTAPIGYVSDGLHLSDMIDSAVLVVRWGRTSVGTLRRVLALNLPLARKIVGVCLSRTTAAGLRRHETLPANAAYYNTLKGG